MMNNKITTRMAVIAVAALALSLIPLLAMSHYLHPMADDYVFAASTHQAWLRTHSLAAVIKAAFDVAVNMYHNWQGTYTACFTMALQPGAFGHYWLTPFILAGSYIAASYTFGITMMRRIMKARTSEAMLATTVITMISMQFVASFYDAFFWFNGAVYYTFYYSVMLVLAATLAVHATTCGIKRIATAAVAMPLTIFLAGGNFSTGLAIPAILLFTIVAMRLQGKRIPRLFFAVFAVYCLAFLPSVLAPGNEFRRIAEPHSVNPVMAAFMAIGKGTEFMAQSANPIMLLLFAAITPTLAKMARRSRFSFGHPWLVLTASLCLYFVFVFPVCYALGIKGPGRMQNIYTYNMCWLIAFNIFYLAGAAQHRRAQGGMLSSHALAICSIMRQRMSRYRRLALPLFAVLLVSSAILKISASSKAARLIRKGTAATYDREMTMRERKLAEPAATAVLPPSTVKIPSDAFNDITVYRGYWVNRGISMYYGKQWIAASKMPVPKDIAAETKRKCLREVGPGNLVYKEMGISPTAEADYRIISKANIVRRISRPTQTPPRKDVQAVRYFSPSL